MSDNEDGSRRHWELFFTETRRLEPLGGIGTWAFQLLPFL